MHTKFQNRPLLNLWLPEQSKEHSVYKGPEQSKEHSVYTKDQSNPKSTGNTQRTRAVQRAQCIHKGPEQSKEHSVYTKDQSSPKSTGNTQRTRAVQRAQGIHKGPEQSKEHREYTKDQTRIGVMATGNFGNYALGSRRLGGFPHTKQREVCVDSKVYRYANHSVSWSQGKFAQSSFLVQIRKCYTMQLLSATKNQIRVLQCSFLVQIWTRLVFTM